MKKVLILILMVAVAVVAAGAGSMSVMAEGTDAGLTSEQETSIKTHCAIIKDNLKNVQYDDSRVRVHLGRYYETILTDFIMPLNVVLVANNISNVDLIENQSDFTAARAKFASDYIVYQKGLEELVSIDCTVEPVRFYNKRMSVRKERAKVKADTVTLRQLTDKQVRLVMNLKGTL